MFLDKINRRFGVAHRGADHHIDRWAWADVDLDAITSNVHKIIHAVGGADVWVVVKANAYGHGIAPVAKTALNAGAKGLCVALASEGVVLRHAGIDEPILVMSEQPIDDWQTMIDHDLIFTVYTLSTAKALAAFNSVRHPIKVHVKVNTGMNRVGAFPADALEVIEAVTTSGMNLDGVYTHLACADEPQRDENAQQLDVFDTVLRKLEDRNIDVPRVHAANSAAALHIPRSRYQFVRVGIAMYGIQPSSEILVSLTPVMSLRARVSFVHTVAAGEPVSYGARWRAPVDTLIATVPIGYADGVARRLSFVGGEVLIGGSRRPIRGTVTMDQLMVEVDASVAVGDEVVLIGSQGLQTITAEELATKLDTIGYEIVCGVSSRIERRYKIVK